MTLQNGIPEVSGPSDQSFVFGSHHLAMDVGLVKLHADNADNDNGE